MSLHELQRRRAGILLHPTSLPSGILNSDVERWLQMMKETGFSVWQVLPLGEPQSGLSPYQCSSAFAFNPALLPDFQALDEQDSDFIAFCSKQQFWLDDYVLFKVFKQQFDDASWVEWPQPWKCRHAETLQQACGQHQQQLSELKWQQYQLHKRWHDIRKKASDMGILLFGDMPIYVGHDSADVWAHPECFRLDDNGDMTVVSGVPPDYFSATGQRWGNPHYDWDVMRENDFAWWNSRVQHHLEQFDIVRIDHFRGLESAWVIDAACETAIDGYWQKIPGEELLSSIQASIYANRKNHDETLPFVAEDLGIITPEVTALRKKFQLPGMSILQFGFDAFEDNPHKPQNIREDTVVYTGTHDNDTTKGWFNSLEEHVKNHVLHVLELPLTDAGDADDSGVDVADLVVEKMIDNAMSSPANICIIPIQDCLCLGSEARMNTPGTITGNWLWQLRWQQIEDHCDSSRMEQVRLRNERTQRLVD